MIAVSQCLTKLGVYNKYLIRSHLTKQSFLFLVLCDTWYLKFARQQCAFGSKAEYLQTFEIIQYKFSSLAIQTGFIRTDTDHSISFIEVTGRINSALLVRVYSLIHFL